MTELHEDLRGDTKLQARKKQSSSIQITLSRCEGTSLTDGSTKSRKEWVVTNGVRVSIHKVICELPGIQDYV